MTITEATQGAAIGQIAAGTRGATKVYGQGDTQVVALNEVDCSFNVGQFTAIMGPSGSGKSTLMHCLAGLDRLSSGEAYIGSSSLSQLSEKDLTVLRRTKIGFVFQAFNLVPTLTALENITLPTDLGKFSVDQGYLAKVVTAVGLESRLGHKPNELSGGQQQRVAVARALASRPDIIFADEPTGNLDSQTGGEILSFMRQAVNEFGQTIVMVTHDPVAASYADRVLFLADGRVVNDIASSRHDPAPVSSDDPMGSCHHLGSRRHPRRCDWGWAWSGACYRYSRWDLVYLLGAVGSHHCACVHCVGGWVDFSAAAGIQSKQAERVGRHQRKLGLGDSGFGRSVVPTSGSHRLFNQTRQLIG